jgi:hypothetical protein
MKTTTYFTGYGSGQVPRLGATRQSGSGGGARVTERQAHKVEPRAHAMSPASVSQLGGHRGDHATGSGKVLPGGGKSLYGRRAVLWRPSLSEFAWPERKPHSRPRKDCGNDDKSEKVAEVAHGSSRQDRSTRAVKNRKTRQITGLIWCWAGPLRAGDNSETRRSLRPDRCEETES